MAAEWWQVVVLLGVCSYPVIRLEVIDILAKDERPQVLAQKLDDVERVVEPRPVAREAASC